MRNSDGSVMFDGYADEAGPDVGCVGPVTLNPVSYRIQILSEALLWSNTLRVWNNDLHNQLFAFVESDWTPGPASTKVVTTWAAEHWNIFAAASWAWSLHTAGLGAESLVIYNKTCEGGGSCFNPDVGRVYICTEEDCTSEENSGNHKYLVVHEMGHAVAFLANDGAETNVSYAASASVCTWSGSHHMDSEEYQGAAANEGIAHFWAAVAFNDVGEDDCMFDYYGTPNWDHSGTANPDQISCEGNPDTGDPVMDEADYHGDVCGGSAEKGTEYDWLRFWWDLATDEGLDLDQIYAIFAGSSPESWAADGSGVADGLLESAEDLGPAFGDAYDAQDHVNGVHR